MSIAVTSSPVQINSVADNIEYELTISSPVASDLNLETIGSTPYGLTKFSINHDPSYTPPTLAVGSIIYITDSTNDYYNGAHTIVEVLTSLTCVVNTIYKGADTLCRFDVYANFDYTLIETINFTDSDYTVISVLKGIPKSDNTIKLNVAEYLRSSLNENKPSLTFTLLEFPSVDRSMVCNSTIKHSDMTDFFDADDIIIETSDTLVFFEGYQTYISTSDILDFPIVIREITNIAPFTQGSTFTHVKKYSQSVEVMNGCFKDALNIVFINFAGGLRNYVVFNDIANGRDFENETTFKNSSLELRTLQVQSYKTYNVLTENVRITHADTVEQMIASPYTWLEVDGELVPIVIEKASFQKYRSYDESLTISFNFRMSETKQSQVY